MTRKIEVPIHLADIYKPTVKAAVVEGLEPFPGKDGQAFAVGMSASVEDGLVEIASNFHAWWVHQADDAIVCADLARVAPDHIQKRCAHAAFATVGDNTCRSVLHNALAEAVEKNASGIDHGDYDVLFMRQGILAHLGSLTYDIEMRRADEDGPIDDGACRSAIVAICPEHASQHEKMAFLEAANGYLKRKIAEELRNHRASSYRALYEDLQITLAY